MDYKKQTEENIQAIVAYAKTKKDFDLLSSLVVPDDKKIEALWKHYETVVNDDKKTSTGKGSRSNLSTTFRANYSRRKKVASMAEKDSNEDFKAMYAEELAMLDWYVTKAILLSFK